MAGFYDGRLVAVTGGTGLNGSYVIKELVEAGARVRAVTHQRPANEFTNLAQERVKADLLDGASTRKAVRGAEIVFHAGGVTGGVPLAVKDPGALVAPNAIISSQIIDACAKESVERLGFISSTVVYPPSSKPVTEDMAWSGEPYDLYFGIAWVKRFAEKLCKFYYDKCGLKVAIVRPSGAYGRYDNFDEKTSHVLPAFIMRALSGADPFVIWGDGKDVRDFVHASDLAHGFVLAVEKHPTCDPINIASGKPCTTRELAEITLRQVKSKSKIVCDASKPTALPVRKIDITKARRLLGYEPRVSLEAGLADTIQWLKGRSQPV